MICHVPSRRASSNRPYACRQGVICAFSRTYTVAYPTATARSPSTSTTYGPIKCAHSPRIAWCASPSTMSCTSWRPWNWTVPSMSTSQSSAYSAAVAAVCHPHRPRARTHEDAVDREHVIECLDATSQCGNLRGEVGRGRHSGDEKVADRVPIACLGRSARLDFSTLIHQERRNTSACRNACRRGDEAVGNERYLVISRTRTPVFPARSTATTSKRSTTRRSRRTRCNAESCVRRCCVRW